MITKNSKDMITLLKWLQANACNSKDARNALMKIHITAGEETVSLETTNGFVHTKAVISNINNFPIDLPGPGLYDMVLLSHQTVEWQEDLVGYTYPDVANTLYPLNPKFLAVDAYTNFSAVTCLNPSLLVKFLPTFIPHIELCMNGNMIGIQGKVDIDDDKHPVEITGLMMPVHGDDPKYLFGSNTKTYINGSSGAWLEILQPIVEPVFEFVPKSEPVMEAVALS
jgi:hypothetical protein